MANRNVFKILSSVGPGGCIAAFTEKLCHNLYFDAYEQGDPADIPSQEFQEKSKKQRQEYVDALFERRGGFEREMLSLNEATQDKAYKELVQIIYEAKVQIAKSEMSRLARERLFFKPNSLQYRRLVDKSRRVDADTTDNLIKMALHIVKQAQPEKLQAEYTALAGTSPDLDLEEANIEQRISAARAGQLLADWKKILLEYRADGGDADALFSDGLDGTPNQDLEGLKDKLFIATGEDQLDTWEAFQHYKLDPKLTAEDLSRA